MVVVDKTMAHEMESRMMGEMEHLMPDSRPLRNWWKMWKVDAPPVTSLLFSSSIAWWRCGGK